jgi:hypothetical protein
MLKIAGKFGAAAMCCHGWTGPFSRCEAIPSTFLCLLQVLDVWLVQNPSPGTAPWHCLGEWTTRFPGFTSNDCRAVTGQAPIPQ